MLDYNFWRGRTVRRRDHAADSWMANPRPRAPITPSYFPPCHQSPLQPSHPQQSPFCVRTLSQIARNVGQKGLASKRPRSRHGAAGSSSDAQRSSYGTPCFSSQLADGASCFHPLQWRTAQVTFNARRAHHAHVLFQRAGIGWSSHSFQE